MDFGFLTKNGQRSDAIIMSNKCLVDDVNIHGNASNHTIDNINYLTQVSDVECDHIVIESQFVCMCTSVSLQRCTD